MENICIHVYVSGYVQGIGYRYSAIRCANGLGVTGWVKNLRDGRVELLIEGEESSVRNMVDWCAQGPRGSTITNIETELRPYLNKYLSFDVRF